MKLSDAQRAAVERAGQDVCCVAGPGSGKTRVLVERFAWLASTTARPEAILAITFTEKAAQEIKSRLVKHFTELRHAQLRRKVERAQVSTIHGFCNGILAEFALDAGLDPNFRLLDEYESKLEHARAVESALNRFSLERPDEFRALVEAWAVDDFAASVRGISDSLRYAGGAAKALAVLPTYNAAGLMAEIDATVLDGLERSEFKSAAQAACRDDVRSWLDGRSLTPLARLRQLTRIKLPRGATVEAMNAALKAARELAVRAQEEIAGEINLPALATLRTILIECERAYRGRKRELSALDFTDLEEYTVALLEENAPVRQQIAERFDAILMDELQDTNRIQWRIVNALRRPGRFFAVGDVNQSIFGFRGAEPGQLAAYQQSFEKNGWQIDRLQTNYRSREAILGAVQRICVDQALPGIQDHQLLAGRVFGSTPEYSVEAIRVEEDGPEAEWVARRIVELRATLRVGDPPRPLRWSDIAILSRNATVFDEYEAALRKAGVVCVVQRGRNFFDEPEIVDLTNLLRVLVNPENGIAVLGLLRSPLAGVSDDEIYERHTAGLPLAPERVQARIEELRALREEVPADRLLTRWLDESGHWARLGDGARANVHKLMSLLRGGLPAGSKSLAAQLEALDGLRQAGRENNAPLAESADAVQLLTVHASKGLEFPVVFLVSMHKGTGGKQARAPIALHREGERYSLGATWRMTGEDGTLPDREMHAAEDARKRREAEEEDRLLYVAMTRAEERLVLVWSEKKSPDRRWLMPVSEGLNLDWEIEAGEAVVRDGIRMFRAVGVPPAETVAGDEHEAPQAPRPVVLLDPLAVSLPEPASVPATQLARFSACPRRYFLRTLLNWPATLDAPLAPFDEEPTGERADSDAPAPGPGGMNFGDAVHHLLAGADRSAAPPEALALVDRFQASATGRRAARATRSGHETPILFEFEGLLIRGAIDLWFEEGGELILVDYKTDQYIGAERLHEYSTQLRFYAAALSRALNRKVDRAMLAALRSGQEIEVPLTPEANEELCRLVDAFRQAHRDGGFPLMPGTQCRWCQYAGGACPQPRPEPSPEPPPES